MSTSEDEQAEARFEAWDERTKGGTLPLDDLPRGKGDGDWYGYPGQKPDNVKYIGEDKPVITHLPFERDMDMPSWWERELGDRMADGSDDQPREVEDL